MGRPGAGSAGKGGPAAALRELPASTSSRSFTDPGAARGWFGRLQARPWGDGPEQQRQPVAEKRAGGEGGEQQGAEELGPPTRGARLRAQLA